MRVGHLVLAAVALIGGSTACTRRGSSTVAPLQTQFVQISLQCNSGGVSASVRPWRLRAKKTDLVQFRLMPGGAGDVSQVVIRPVNLANWPLMDPTGAKQFPATIERVTPPSATTSFRPRSDMSGTVDEAYRIEATCTFDGESRTVVIDPDMIVDF